ncbi:MAG: photosynthetic complex assembly protein PuhC [Pseudomonadota bacterium]
MLDNDIAPDSHQEPPFPRYALYFAGILIVFSIALAVTGRSTGYGTTSVAKSTPLMERELRFLDQSDGSIQVLAAPENRDVATLPPGTSGFVRVVMRGLARHRKLRGVGDAVPFRLTQWRNGRLSIFDPVTRKVVYLGAFGKPNRQAFARLLTIGGSVR